MCLFLWWEWHFTSICIYLFSKHFVSLSPNVQILPPWYLCTFACLGYISLWLSFSLLFFFPLSLFHVLSVSLPSSLPFFSLSLRANWGVMVCKWTCKGALVIINRHLCLIKCKNNLTSGKNSHCWTLAICFKEKGLGY